MTDEFLYNFISGKTHAVLSTVAEGNVPESALLTIAVTRDLQIIFNTNIAARKYENLLHNQTVSLVVGWEDEQTLQYEGIATLIDVAASSIFLDTFFSTFPESTARNKCRTDLSYFYVQPSWIRFADYNHPKKIEEKTF